MQRFTCDKVFKNGTSRICGTLPLNHFEAICKPNIWSMSSTNFTWSILKSYFHIKFKLRSGFTFDFAKIPNFPFYSQVSRLLNTFYMESISLVILFSPCLYQTVNFHIIGIWKKVVNSTSFCKQREVFGKVCFLRNNFWMIFFNLLT